MARPRVFISSTYFDLKAVREDLDRFITSMGYEPVRHEVGQVAYGRDDRPEAYAYREIEFCDVLISIIGSKFGTASAGSEYSISQEELKKAHAHGKQVHIFIERAVHHEFRFYQANKGNTGVKYTSVTDTRIFDFIEEIYALSKGNPIFAFETGAEIVDVLREQWAGIFQRLLTQEAGKSQANLIEQLQLGLQTVDQMVKYLQDDRSKSASAIQEIVLSNHPIFKALRDSTKNPYRLFFQNLNEFEEWLQGARSYRRIESLKRPDYIAWTRALHPVRKDAKTEHQQLYVAKSLFDESGRLKPMGQSEWDDDYLVTERTAHAPNAFEDMDDDIPF